MNYTPGYLVSLSKIISDDTLCMSCNVKINVMSEILYDMEGVIFNIQRYSLHDGPGIRTIPFLKGCPLSCKWCSNPESQRPQPEIIFQRKNCIDCGKCVSVCRFNALSKVNTYFVDRNRCTSCGECTKVCPTQALELKGKRMTVWEVMQELEKDESIYRRSNGGITLSGGEPLSQPEFATELLKACKKKGWHTAIETSSMATKEAVEMVFPYVDLALADIKAINPVIHKEATGVHNQQILENIIKISYMTDVVVRIPIIPDFNDNIQEVRAIVEFTKLMHNVDTIHLLPYHSYGENKYNLLGRIYPMGSTASIAEERMNTLKEEVEKIGYTCYIGG